ncbi:hypothetical protein [Amphibacillus cookii]|uniref:hypothetical protein n=1 Tax=Amphibacillus cookii TaxID=767787 RepID=UPI00195D1AFE|nr:hypothetical protein [Amphibacillus cookii]MBM7540337.1 hypothetical protein [Amphibacillus cookii]
MQQAILLGPFVIRSSDIFLIISLAIGLVFFLLTTTLSKALRRVYLYLFVDLISFFILILIAAKALLHIELFLSDPLAVLAHPSNANGFYLATLISGLYAYRKIRVDLFSFDLVIEGFIRLFFSANFVYLFSLLILLDREVSIYQLTFHFVTLLIIIFYQDRNYYHILNPLIVGTWGLGHVVLSLSSQVQLFGFYLSYQYYFIIGIIGFLHLYNAYKSRSKEKILKG